MTTAYKSLRSGLEADISIMAANNFIDTHTDIIEDIFLCIEIVNLGRNALSEEAWLETLKLYGFNSYRKVNEHMEKKARSKDKATINIKKSFPLDRKQKILKKYAFRLPEFKISQFNKTVLNQYIECM